MTIYEVLVNQVHPDEAIQEIALEANERGGFAAGHARSAALAHSPGPGRTRPAGRLRREDRLAATFRRLRQQLRHDHHRLPALLGHLNP